MDRVATIKGIKEIRDKRASEERVCREVEDLGGSTSKAEHLNHLVSAAGRKRTLKCGP